MDFILENSDAENCYYMEYCPNGNTEASCPAATFVDTGGMPDCRGFNYAWVFSLVVNKKCYPASIHYLASHATNCQ